MITTLLFLLAFAAEPTAPMTARKISPSHIQEIQAAYRAVEDAQLKYQLILTRVMGEECFDAGIRPSDCEFKNDGTVARIVKETLSGPGNSNSERVHSNTDIRK